MQKIDRNVETGKRGVGIVRQRGNESIKTMNILINVNCNNRIINTFIIFPRLQPKPP